MTPSIRPEAYGASMTSEHCLRGLPAEVLVWPGAVPGAPQRSLAAGARSLWRWGSLATQASRPGSWKHAGIDVEEVLRANFVLGKTVVSAGFWPSRGRRHEAHEAGASGPLLAYTALAALLNGLAWVAYLYAFARGPLAIVQTISASYSAVAVVLALLFLRERLLGAQVAGVVLVIVASMLLGYAGEVPSAGGRGGWLPACFASAVPVGRQRGGRQATHEFLPERTRQRFLAVHGLGLAATVLPYGLWLAPAAAGTGEAGLFLPTLLVVLLYLAGDLGVYGAMARGPAGPSSTRSSGSTRFHAQRGAGDRRSPRGLEWSAMRHGLGRRVLVLPAAENPLTRLLARPAKARTDP